MLSADAVLKAAAAVVAGALAILVIVASRRDRAARWLGVFFALIAANQGAELVRSLAADPLPAYRVATIMAALDPVALWMFVHVLVRREPTRAQLAMLTLPAAALALLAGWALQPFGVTPGSHLIPAMLAAYTAGVYLLATMMALGKMRDEPDEPRWRPLTAACVLVVVPQIVALVDYGFLVSADIPPPGVRLAVAAGALVVAIVGAWVTSSKRWPAESRRTATLALIVAISLLAASKTLEVVSAITRTPDFALDPRWVLPGRASASVKWLVFGVLVSTVVFRHRALDVSPRRRRHAARTLVALGFLVAAILVLTAFSAIVGARSQGFPWLESIFLLAAVALSQAFQRAVDRVASRVYGTEREEGAAPSDEPIRPGVVLSGRYEVVRYLGRGGAGRVFLARDRVIHRLVALKETPTALAEARAASRVAVPGVVSIYDVLPREEGAILVVEYLEGGTLAERHERGGAIRGAEGVRVALSLLDALAAIHERGLVHGDLKPSNILFDGEARPKIADFGTAWSIEQTTVLETLRSPAGTLGFAAPEMLRGERGDRRADVYAMGVILRRAFELPGLEEVLGRAVAERPEDRHPDGRAFSEAAKRAVSASTEAGSGQRR